MRQTTTSRSQRPASLRTTLRTLVLATTSCAVALPAAAGSLPAFEMAAALDAPGGFDIIRGDYAAAASTAAASRTRVDSLTAPWLESNACIAHTMLGEYEQAAAACDAAVAIVTGNPGMYGTRHAQQKRLALVYANRAILRHAAGDRLAAQSDLQAALDNAPRNALVRANAAAFAARSVEATTASR